MLIEEKGLPRRTLTRAAAWTAPVILASSATPAFAASMCPLKTFIVNLNDLTTSGTKTVTSTDGLSTFQFSYTASNNGAVPVTGNLTVSSSKLWLMQTGAVSQTAGSTVGQSLNFTFSTLVTNVKIGLADLSNTGYLDAFQDQVTMYSSAPNNSGWTGYSGMVQDGSSTTWYRNSTLGSASYTLTNLNQLYSFGLLYNNRKAGVQYSLSKYQDMSITSLQFDAYICT